MEHFVFNCAQKSNQSVLLHVTEVSRALRILNNSDWVRSFKEYFVDVFTECCVVDEPSAIDFVFLYQGVDIFFAEPEVEGTKACPELKKTGQSSKN